MSKGTPGNPVGSRRGRVPEPGIQTPDAPQVRSNEYGLLSIQTSGIGAAKDGNGKPPAIFSISPCPTGLGRQEYRTSVGAQDQPGTVIMQQKFGEYFARLEILFTFAPR